jgi:hypothetical protein
MTHMSLKTPQVAIVHDDYQRVKLGPPHPSAHLPHDMSLAYLWVTRTLSMLSHRATSVGVVGCCPTH